MLCKRHACQQLQEQKLVLREQVLPPLEQMREQVLHEQVLQQQRELVRVLELELELQQLVLVRDHHVQERQQGLRQAHYVNRANLLHEYRLRQVYHRDRLFSASNACSVRQLQPRVRHAHPDGQVLCQHSRQVPHDQQRRAQQPVHAHQLL